MWGRESSGENVRLSKTCDKVSIPEKFDIHLCCQDKTLKKMHPSLQPPTLLWEYSCRPAKLSLWTKHQGGSCYAASGALKNSKGFACHTGTNQWVIWGRFCNCQKSVPVQHGTKQKKAAYNRTATTVFENKQGIWKKKKKRELLQNMLLEKTKNVVDAFCSFTKKVIVNA